MRRPLLAAAVLAGALAAGPGSGQQGAIVTSLTLFAGTSEGLWRSTDWAGKWERVSGRTAGVRLARPGAGRGPPAIARRRAARGADDAPLRGGPPPRVAGARSRRRLRPGGAGDEGRGSAVRGAGAWTARGAGPRDRPLLVLRHGPGGLRRTRLGGRLPLLGRREELGGIRPRGRGGGGSRRAGGVAL